MSMRSRGLGERVLIGSAAMTLVIAIALALQLFAVDGVHTASQRIGSSARAASVANEAETLAIDLETGLRGYLISGRAAFGAPSRAARRRLPGLLRKLVALEAGDPRQRVLAGVIRRDVNDYMALYMPQVLAAARRSLPVARRIEARGDGKRRMDVIRGLFAGLLTRQARIGAASESHGESAAARARILGLVVLAVTVIVLLIRGAWLVRAVARPVRALARVAEDFGAGQFDRRLEIGRSDEIGALATAFNVMADEIASDRRELERRVAELAEANGDLEAFTYTVAHDLRSPIRGIVGFAQILEDEHKAELTPDAQHVLERVADNGRQMAALIDDLLDFARLGRADASRHQLEPAPIARKVFAELVADGQRIEWRVDEIPACDADRVLVHQIFTNLISNALKFSARSARPLVEVGSVGSNGDTAYFVRDNGIGFDMQYADRLFGVFERLQVPEAYEGTGVGLAIVQRAVTKHHGRVWAEAEPGRGATFYFTLKPDNGGST